MIILSFILIYPHEWSQLPLLWARRPGHSVNYSYDYSVLKLYYFVLIAGGHWHPNYNTQSSVIYYTYFFFFLNFFLVHSHFCLVQLIWLCRFPRESLWWSDLLFRTILVMAYIDDYGIYSWDHAMLFPQFCSVVTQEQLLIVGPNSPGTVDVATTSKR